MTPDHIQSMIAKHRRDRAEQDKPERTGWLLAAIVIAGLAGLVLIAVALLSWAWVAVENLTG